MGRKLSKGNADLLAAAKADLVNARRVFPHRREDDLRTEVLIARYRGHSKRCERPIAKGAYVCRHTDYDDWVHDHCRTHHLEVNHPPSPVPVRV
jgi:hypothetical protein